MCSCSAASRCRGRPRNRSWSTELKKQYDVVEVDPSKPIKDRYDVLLAVQPSSLSPEAMENFVEAVKSGQPTAIFEDPFPWPPGRRSGRHGAAEAAGGGGMMGMFGGGGPPEPKGDISQLWKLLGVEMYGDEIVWQDFNPEPKLGDILPRNGSSSTRIWRRRRHAASVRPGRSDFGRHAASAVLLAGFVPPGRQLEAGFQASWR